MVHTHDIIRHNNIVGQIKDLEKSITEETRDFEKLRNEVMQKLQDANIQSISCYGINHLINFDGLTLQAQKIDVLSGILEDLKMQYYLDTNINL